MILDTLRNGGGRIKSILRRPRSPAGGAARTAARPAPREKGRALVQSREARYDLRMNASAMPVPCAFETWSFVSGSSNDSLTWSAVKPGTVIVAPSPL